MTHHDNPYLDRPLTRGEIESRRGLLLLDFGTNWCAWCRRAEPLVSAALADHPGLHHLRVEDGPGRPLGRAFGVKLWPTLVLLRDGQEVGRLVRPGELAEIASALAALAREGP